MSLKILNYIRNKNQLQQLFISQLPSNFIRSEIKVILKETRPKVTEGARLFAKNISTLEAIIFIYKYGIPDGYLLSEELELKLEDYRQSIAKKR